MLKLDNMLGFGAIITTTKSVTVQSFASLTHDKYPIKYHHCHTQYLTENPQKAEIPIS